MTSALNLARQTQLHQNGCQIHGKNWYHSLGDTFRGYPQRIPDPKYPRLQGRAGIREDQVFGLSNIDHPARRNAGALRSAAQDAAPGNCWQETLRKDLLARLEQSRNVSRQGDFRDGATLAQGGYRDSRSAGETQIAAQFLNVLGGCRFAVHQYRDALQTYLEARKLAEASHDNATAAKLDLNISSLYSHLGQIDAATEAIASATAQLSGPGAPCATPQITHPSGCPAGGPGPHAPRARSV